MDDRAAYRGFDLLLSQPRATRPADQVHLVHHWPDNALKVTTSEPLPADAWSHVFVTYDGSGKAAGLKVYVNGRPCAARRSRATRSKTRSPPAQPLRLGRRSTSLHASTATWPTSGSIARTLSPAEVASVAFAAAASDCLRSPPRPATGRRQELLDQVFRATRTRRVGGGERTRLGQLRKEKADYEKAIPTVMVMEDLPKPRPTFVLKRGQYDMPDKSQQGRPGRPGLPAAAAAPDAPGATASAWPAGWCRPGQPADGPRRRQPLLAAATSAPAWSRRPRTSASRASRRRTPSCSTGWRPSSSAPAGT